MPSSNTLYLVSANQLNLRASPGTESPVVKVLSKGDKVTFIAESDVAGWWSVQATGVTNPGYVARQYLQPAAGGGVSEPPGFNETLWRCTQAAAGKVRYQLGAKSSAGGKIDCSGWVYEITRQACEAVNTAASPETVFHTADIRSMDNNSDGIICALERRTGFVLHGEDVKPEAMRPGMLIGVNFGDYKWELSHPPRVYGIDHIVEVVRDPSSQTLYISQSSSSGNGVNLAPLGQWLTDKVQKGIMKAGRIHAVDPLLLTDIHTTFYQNLAGSGLPPAAPSSIAAAPTPPTPDKLIAFKGRGFYVYSVANLITQLGSVASAITEIQRCRSDHLWVRIHGRDYIGESADAHISLQKDFIKAAQDAGIHVAGWGWVQGDDPDKEAGMAVDALEQFGLSAYIADIEQDVNGSDWDPAGVNLFFTTLRSGFNNAVAVTSHGFIDYHKPELFKGLGNLIDAVNPQTYWYTCTPSAKMLAAVKATAANYPLNSPASYARLCADRWSTLYKLPVVISGQAYPDTNFSAAEMTAQLQRFVTDMPARPPNVIGVNLWHLGAMNAAARDIWAKSTLS